MSAPGNNHKILLPSAVTLRSPTLEHLDCSGVAKGTWFSGLDCPKLRLLNPPDHTYASLNYAVMTPVISLRAVESLGGRLLENTDSEYSGFSKVEGDNNPGLFVDDRRRGHSSNNNVFVETDCGTSAYHSRPTRNSPQRYTILEPFVVDSDHFTFAAPNPPVAVAD